MVTDEQREKIKAAWVFGRSGGEIATDFGVTRSAVLGIVSRAGLMGRHKDKQTHRTNVAAPLKRPKATASKPVPVEGPLAIGPIGDFPPRETCRYPYVDGKDFQMCGHPGHPWCEHHRQIVFRKDRAASQ